ncbi:hypothetical protein [Dyadobacter sp. OTU695]|uniref:hypothetical protein n=1 Tax=Dyadobacter sp. OTU695 TaxID=3043860 RepID=UPI00313E878A
MNQTFNIHRFTLMLRIDWADKGKNYLLMAGVLISCLLILMVPVALSDEYGNFREVLHYFALIMVLLLGGSLYTSNAFSQYSASDTGIAATMLPASGVEKFLSSLLINLLFVISFLVFFWQFHYWIIDIANKNLPASSDKYRYIPEDFMLYSTYSYFGIQSAVFLGSVYFRKSAYIKTAAVFIGFACILTLINLMFATRLASNPSKIVAFPLTGWKLWYYSKDGMSQPEYVAGFYHLTFPPEMFTALQIFSVFIALMLWTCAYFQMKEREI